MSQVFNPPPNWPKPPAGWFPPPEWRPDPAWGSPPPGWSLWLDPEDEGASPDAGVDGKQHIFISYRHSDCQAQANGLYDGLGHRLRNATLFMDIDSIPPGVDFEQHIRDEIRRSDVILVMIGDNWLDGRPGTNRRRIDEPNDFVRLEIENALALPNVRIIPILVERAQMPPAEELPVSISQLARLHAFELSDHRWSSDVERLARTLELFGSGRVPPGLDDPQPDVRKGGTAVGWMIATTPLLTCGFASFAPALWARSQRPGDPVYRRRMLMFSIIVGIANIGSFVLIGVSGSATASPELNPISSIAATFWFGTIVIATVVAILNRKPAQRGLRSAEDHRQRPGDSPQP